MRKNSDWVSASEIGSWVYCGRKYHMEKVQKIRPTGRGAERLKAGTERHHTHGVRYDWQLRLRGWGIRLVLLALAAGALLLFLKSRSA